jgi:thiol-disulfide isomerase/thioredoxin
MKTREYWGGFGMSEIKSDKEFAQVVQKDRVVVEFYATWCPDCHLIAPYFTGWKEQYADKFTLVKADRDILIETAEKYDVLGIPSFIAFEDGKEVARLVSRDTKTKTECEAFFDSAYPVRSR